MTRNDYHISGMDCAEEVRAIESEFSKLQGIEQTSFDVLRARMTVNFDDRSITDKDIRQAVARAGLRADTWNPGHAERQSDHSRLTAMLISGALLLTAACAQIILYGWHHMLTGADEPALAVWIKVLFLGSAIAGAWFVFPRAVRAARSLRPDMNLLMTIAIIGAIAIGEWFEAASVAFLFALSLVLERWSVGRASKAVNSLLSLTPPTARIQDRDGRDAVVPVEEVSAGTTIYVHPGEKIALDGIVHTGSSWVNQAPITGESSPVSKSAGDEVFAGSINGDGALQITVSHPSSDSLLAKVGRLIEEARLQRSGHEQWVDRFARYYTPIVMLLAVAFAVLPPLVAGGSWSQWFYNALVLLVIACPCALVISTPVSVVAALTAAARRGILIKGGVHVESPAHLRAIAFDKTGTITTGTITVTQVTPLSGHTETELLQIAAALEQRSNHPLARAIIEHAKAAGITADAAENLQMFPGKGAEGMVLGEVHWIGSHRFLEERGQETPDVHEALNQLAANGASVVVVGGKTHVCGFFSLSDEIKPDAPAVINELRHLGVKRIVMLTGDNLPTAQTIANRAGIEEIIADMLPQDKSRVVAEITAAAGGATAMMGDGVNDAPAMAAATLGIAMGGRGTDVAMETADIVLMNDDLDTIPWLIRHSRRTVAVIRQNIFMALFFKALFMALAAAGMATLWMAIAADMGVSLLAVFNSFRILNSSHDSPRD